MRSKGNLKDTLNTNVIALKNLKYMAINIYSYFLDGLAKNIITSHFINI